MAHTPEYNARRRNEYKRLRALGYEPDQARSLRRVSPAPRRPVPFNYSGDPLANFRRWSRPKVGFPSRALAWIYKANDDAGLDEHASFGHRYYYHIYVEKLSDARAIQASEGQKT